MEINIRDESKLVEVWLTNQEKNDPKVQEKLKPLYAQYKAKKYMVAVFQSGERELRPSVSDLLAHNRKRCAEVAVQREKKQRSASMER